MKKLYEEYFNLEEEVENILELKKDNIIYTPCDDKKYLRKLQIENGTQNIINIPIFDFFVERKHNENKICYVIYGKRKTEKFDNIEKIITKHVHKKFNVTQFIYEEDTELYINENIPDQHSLIVVIDTNIETIFNIISLGISFIIFCNRNEIFLENVKNLGLRKNIHFETEYCELRNIFSEYYPQIKRNIKRRRKKYENIREGLKQKLFLVSKNFKKEHENQLIFSDTIRKFNFNYFSTETSFKYINFIFENLENQMIENSVHNGIFFTFSVVDLFIMKRKVLYYPWIGLIETINTQDVSDLIRSDTFINSFTNCYGLFVFTERIYKIFEEHINKYNYIIPIKLLELPKINHSIVFNLDKFKEIPFIVNFGKTKLNISCLELYNNELNLVIEENEYDEEQLYENSIIVLTSDYPSPLGIFYNCICTETPIILRRDTYFERILGENYPLFMEDRIDKYKVINFITEEIIEEAYDILKSIDYISIEEFISNIEESQFVDFLSYYDE